MLRDLDGVVHFVPNGEIRVASNLTRGWSRVNMNISVGYGEDLDRVIAVINRVGSDLPHSKLWGILDTPAKLRTGPLSSRQQADGYPAVFFMNSPRTRLGRHLL